MGRQADGSLLLQGLRPQTPLFPPVLPGQEGVFREGLPGQGWALGPRLLPRAHSSALVTQLPVTDKTEENLVERALRESRFRRQAHSWPVPVCPSRGPGVAATLPSSCGAWLAFSGAGVLH